MTEIHVEALDRLCEMTHESQLRNTILSRLSDVRARINKYATAPTDVDYAVMKVELERIDNGLFAIEDGEFSTLAHQAYQSLSAYFALIESSRPRTKFQPIPYQPRNTQ